MVVDREDSGLKEAMRTHVNSKVIAILPWVSYIVFEYQGDCGIEIKSWFVPLSRKSKHINKP